MAVEPIPNYTHLTSDDLHEIESIAGAYVEDDRQFPGSRSSHTAGRSAHAAGYPFNSHERPQKRQRVDSPLPPNMQIDTPSSRDMMPPPAKPLSQMRSVKALIPNIRKKFMGNRSSPKDVRRNGDEVHTFTQMHVRTPRTGQGDQREALGRSDTYNVKHLQTPIPLMSGALPPGELAGKLRVFGARETGADASQFSFRASSPVKINTRRSKTQAEQFPTEASYLNLMDGLSYDNGIDFSIKDPRDNVSGGYDIYNTTTHSDSPQQYQHGRGESLSQQYRSVGSAFLHGSSANSPRQLNGQQCSPSPANPKGFFTRAHYDSSVGVANPNFPQHQQPVDQAQNVVSSFFGRRQHDAPTMPRPSNTETQTSSHPSVAFPSQMHPAAYHRNILRDQRNLSRPFMDDLPRSPEYESFPDEGYRRPPLQDPRQMYGSTSARNMPSNPLTPSFMDSSNYVSPRRATHSIDQQHHAWNPLSPVRFNQSTSSGIARLPSRNPSITSRPSKLNLAQWDTLQQTGMRSNRQIFEKEGCTSRVTSVHPIPRNKRRSVRR